MDWDFQSSSSADDDMEELPCCEGWICTICNLCLHCHALMEDLVDTDNMDEESLAYELDARSMCDWRVVYPCNDSKGAYWGQAVSSLSYLRKKRCTSNRTPGRSSSSGSEVCDEDGAYLVLPKLLPPAVKFESRDEYRTFFRNLVNSEGRYQKRTVTKSGCNEKFPITVWWGKKFNNKCVANFKLPTDDQLPVTPGDTLKLKYGGDADHSPWQSEGRVVKFTDDETVTLEFRSSKGVPMDMEDYFSVEFIWNGYCSETMLAAIDKLCFSETQVDRYIYDRFLGNKVKPPSAGRLIPPGLGACRLTRSQPKFDEWQVHAIETALRQPLSLICGFPGTGKTSVAVAIAHHLSTLGNGQVLVCAHRNDAVDHLARKISVAGLKVVRLCAKYTEDLSSPVNDLTLHYQTRKKLETRYASELITLWYSKENEGTLTRLDENKFRVMKRAAETDVLRSANVICCTCFGAGDSRFERNDIWRDLSNTVVIDDAQEASEPESIIPLVIGCKQVVLVGDQNQLGPVVKCKEAARGGLKMSLFERLLLLGEKPIWLKGQHRMHPCLSKFPSAEFYGWLLEDGLTSNLRRPEIGFPWPVPKMPMFFYTSLGQAKASENGKSYVNRKEAFRVTEVVSRLVKCGVKPSKIGVMTPYKGQRACIVDRLITHHFLWNVDVKNIEVGPVDSFQGREKDYMILSCVSSDGVRDDMNLGIAPLCDRHRVNVALTRARLGMIIVGNPQFLSGHPVWDSLLTYFKEHKCLVEGELEHLKESHVQF